MHPLDYGFFILEWCGDHDLEHDLVCLLDGVTELIKSFSFEDADVLK